MPAHKGFVWLDLLFLGRAAHGSRPDEGIDAVRHGALFVASLDALARELAAEAPHPLLGHGTFHVGTIHGGTAPSVYPAECRLSLERRILPGEGIAAATEPFRRALGTLSRAEPDLKAELTVGLSRPGTEVAPDSALVVGLLNALERQGMDRRMEGMTAWVDAAFLNEAGTPAVCFGPGSIAEAHSADEWCDVGQIETCARVLEDFARSFLAGE
jgi:acetylornithine deacetylase